MPEGKKYTQSKELNTNSSSSSIKSASSVTPPVISSPNSLHPETHDTATSKYSTFFIYFSKWKHLRTLIGTASCWFLLDVAFHGTNLNQSVLLTEIGFSTGKNEYDILFRNALGNLIIAAAGYVPGYFFTIYFIEKLGRRWIQIQGFLVCALMFGILAGDYGNLGTAPKFVCFAVAQVCMSLLIVYHIDTVIPAHIYLSQQFFFNFGPNATTFIIPAEVFPSRVRGLGHGFSAAVGKMGAILSALLFNFLSGKNVIGLANVLWIFFACNVLGAVLTFFLIPETKGLDADVLDFEEWQNGVKLKQGSVKEEDGSEHGKGAEI